MSWQDGERATVFVGTIISAIFLATYIFLVPIVWDFSTLRTSTGLPLAADFSIYWAASKLALGGTPTLAYDLNELHELQEQLLHSRHRYIAGFYYPPVFLLMVLPLGLMPYFLSFSVWIGITLLLYLFVLSRISPHPILLPLIFLFPGIYENFIFGQNGYLSGLLLGGGLLLLDKSPWLAGCLIGFLCYKPQFFMIVLIALMIGRYWKSLISAIATTIILSLSSIMVFGYKIWIAYAQVMSIPARLLEEGQVYWNMMPTFFAATRSAGFGVKAAYLVQGVAMLVVISGVAWVWMRKANLALRGSVLTLAVLLFTPYAYIYDLAILALPLCWLWEEGRVRGRLPGELILLGCGWLVPFAIPYLWDMINVFHGKLQIGPLVLLALFLLVLIKTKISQSSTNKLA